MRRVTIQRSKWGTNALRNKAGRYCCLGFCAKAAGITDEQMQGVGLPGDLNYAYAYQFDNYFPTLGNVAGELAEINDSNKRKHNKEKDIKALGKSVGVDFRFVD